MSTVREVEQPISVASQAVSRSGERRAFSPLCSLRGNKKGRIIGYAKL